jgi:hypothetical protein
VASLTGGTDATLVSDAIRRNLIDQGDDEAAADDEVVAKLARYASKHPPEVGPLFDVDSLIGLPVIAGDDVARYTGALDTRTEPLDVTTQVASMAPPFDRFWIEFVGVADPTESGIDSWGWLVEAVPASDDSQFAEVIDGQRVAVDGLRWLLKLRLFLGRERKVVGPVGQACVGLAEDGTLCRHDDGEAVWAAQLLVMPDGARPHFSNDEEERQVTQDAAATWLPLLFPALLTISFMHCRNVETRVVTPPEKVSAKFKKRHGLPLVRYLELEIEPIRKLLEAAGGTTANGLRPALHVCRGHFKVFSSDAPLFGRHSGTYWWAPQIRGSAGSGIVLKDYRVASSRPVGRAWKDAPAVEASAPQASDPENPDAWGEGWAIHNRTVNLLAETLSSAGLDPLRSASDEPDYDIAFMKDGTLFICEVKSLTFANEEKQLRNALGQVLRYRQLLAASGHENVTPVLVGSKPPSDPLWASWCERVDGVLVVSPKDWSERLGL